MTTSGLITPKSIILQKSSWAANTAITTVDERIRNRLQRGNTLQRLFIVEDLWIGFKGVKNFDIE